MSSSSNGATREDLPNADAHSALYHAGIEMRRKVMGNEFVDNQLKKGVSEFSQPIQQLVSETAWGTIWTRPGLQLKQRSLITIAMLACQNLQTELAGHIRGAVNNGATEIEIRETLLQVAVYCGAPTGMAGFRTAEQVIQTLKDEGRLSK